MKSICNLFYKKNLCSYSRFVNRIKYTSASFSTNPIKEEKVSKLNIQNGPGLKDFIQANNSSLTNEISYVEENIPYINKLHQPDRKRKVHFEIYGCQMNVNDTEIVWSILKKDGFIKTDTIKDADVVLIITCAIRDSAEIKIWNRLDYLKHQKKKRGFKIGILGCMAERLKEKLVEKEKSVDLVAGPDSYKDLPRLLALTENNQIAINVLLSLDETYADVTPVRMNENSKSAFVSIMRGCDNMCTYCIVPFTRGRERSRPVDSILDEVRQLSEQGVKEITLLGQNVNSYRDLSVSNIEKEPTKIAKGFNTVYKTKMGGLRFSHLLDKVSLIDPEMRIRFTSPHPKDFPNDVLQLIKERSNICKSLHLPIQSGNNQVLERMRRGYTKESYLELIETIRNYMPSVCISSDFICGFCSETDEEFEDTLDVMKTVKYNSAFLFKYSMREKTTAHRRFQDNVPDDVKQNRLLKMAEVYHKYSEELNKAQIGEIQLVLVEGRSKRRSEVLMGRNDGNLIVVLSHAEAPVSHDSTDLKKIESGDYVAVKIHDANRSTLKATPLFHTTITEFDRFDFDERKLEIKTSV